MKIWLAAALLAASYGCATAPPPAAAGPAIQMGAEVDAPGGFDEMCRRDPAAVECGGAR